MDSKSVFGERMDASIKTDQKLGGVAVIRGFWSAVCKDKNGVEKWAEEWTNIVVNEGLDHLLDVTLSAATATTTWFVGLTDGTPTVAAGDTMASHVGWVEVTDYDEAARQTWTDGGVSSQSVDNSGSPAVFTITSGSTVGGAFLVSVSTKGGSTGVLYAAGAFTGGDKVLTGGDTLTVTATFTTAAV